jgi:hypothetical protein
VIRRFEMYRLSEQAPAGAVDALASACGRAGDFIADVLSSHVGWNRSDAPVHLVWEHAFASVEAYRRYMVHPFHANVLDRYLLHDSPERVVTDDDLGAGLVGYHADGPAFEMTAGVRRLVLLRVDREASASDVASLVESLVDAPSQCPQMTVSVVGANTLGSAWFDGVTTVAGPPPWTHVWEQGFRDQEALDAYLNGPSPTAEAERRHFDDVPGVVRRAASVHYEIDGPRGGRGSGGPGVRQ